MVTGHLLQKLFGTRDEYVVATKVFFETMPGENGRGLSRKHVLASIDASLERLGLDYVSCSPYRVPLARLAAAQAALAEQGVIAVAVGG